ncbi:putative eka-like protein [Erysiphe necator]|uniref:Putative eka-like protein n=1 Tax=Uncinula necator TaxID=52586 RepID=A0A0B1PH65_UNCNE|nr:putative eka-like protein [Erysiphe necator]
MGITQETQALSTETSIEPPPIPNTLPSTTSSTQPSHSQTLHNTTASRKILKPAVPIKRPIPERPPQNNKNSSDVTNSYLPRELAEIVANRQHRKRVWHAHLMICTTIHSCIESNLLNFLNEIEKEEAAAFKDYIHTAITNFAAVDSSPSPPQIPAHTRPTKGDGTVKDESFAKKAVIALPQKPMGAVVYKGVEKETSSLLVNTWATVTRAGHKKARMMLSSKTQVNPTGRQAHRMANKVKPNSSASQTMAISD